MKAITLTLVAFITAISFTMAQRFAFVDTEYILKNIPAYQSAQDKLDQLSLEWQKEIEAVYGDIDKLYKNFQAEKVLLTEEMKVKKEEEIISKEREAKDLQKKYFGKDGELYKKRQDLIKPIQDDIFNAIKEISTEGNLDVVFDTSSGASMLYTNPKLDRSDEVLQKLGYKN